LYDDEPDKIRKEISQRDSFGISDVLAFSSMALMMVSKISIFVNAADGQSDCITDTNGGLFLGCHMESKAIITNFGWVVEMRIPYAALLFWKKQTWGLNFFRK
jgi:hypothetical protein